jgi:coenzyme F420-reducing hydrogenase alpha subunit
MNTTPARAIETAVRGRPYTTPGLLADAIDGHNRTAYQVGACRALEAAFRVEVPESVEALRRLLCCAAWIEGHTTHIHLVQAPDLLGEASAAETARRHREAVARGLELHRLGAALAAAVGEGVLRPASAQRPAPWPRPDRAALIALRPRLDDAVAAALETVRWVAGFDIPSSALDIPLIALDDPVPHPGAHGGSRYPLDTGVGVLASNGTGFTLAEFESFISRPRSAPSHPRRAVLRGTKAALTGPLARYALCGRSLRPAALRAASQAELAPGERNPYRSALIRAVELVHALEEAAAVIDQFPPTGPEHLVSTARAGRGIAAAESPAGLVYQRYDLLPDGTVGAARVIGPDELNRSAIDLDIRRAEREARRDDPDIDRSSLDALRTGLLDNYEPSVRGSFPALDRSGG